MTAITRAFLPALALILVPTAAYADEVFEPKDTDDPRLVAAAQAWDTKDIDDYTITVGLSCFCVERPVVRTVVRNGEVRKVFQGTRRIGLGRGYSMDELYLMIREAHETADHVEVSYTSRGVPKSISIDPVKMAADEERFYSVTLVRS